MVFIEGEIVDINLQFLNNFTVKNGNWTYKCICKDIFPILGSFIKGECSKNYNTYEFLSKPNITNIEYFPFISKNIAENIYKKFIPLDKVKHLSDSISNHFEYLYNSNKYRDYYLRIITEEEYSILYDYLNNNNKDILLMAFGLTKNKLIKLNNFRNEELKDDFINFPFRHYEFTIPQAIALSQFMKLNFDWNDLIVGSIARVMKNIIRDKLWTYSYFGNINSNLIPKLNEHNILLFDNNKISFKEIFSDEEKLAYIFNKYFNEYTLINLTINDSVKINPEEPTKKEELSDSKNKTDKGNPANSLESQEPTKKEELSDSKNKTEKGNPENSLESQEPQEKEELSDSKNKTEKGNPENSLESQEKDYIKDFLNWRPINSNTTVEQQKAIKHSLLYPITIITGEAGTGKSQCIGEIAMALHDKNYQYVCTSFTGRAVSRIKEILCKFNLISSLPCFTLHSLIFRGGLKLKYFNVKYLIIDEASMVSGKLLYKFLKIYKNIEHIIMVGDPNQLDPFRGWGRPFNDLIKSNKIPIFKLTQNFRNVIDDKPNGIVINSKNIISNNYSIVPTDNFFIYNGDISKVVEIINNRVNSGYTHENLKIICPYTKEVDDINHYCQKIFTSNSKFITVSKDLRFFLKDPVIVTRNNHILGIMNGDIGTVVDFTHDSGLLVDFGPTIGIITFYYESEFNKMYKSLHLFRPDDESTIKYIENLICKYLPVIDTANTNNDIRNNIIDIFEDIRSKCRSCDTSKIREAKNILYHLIDDLIDGLQIKYLKLAYALTVHKSQGSEYQYIIYYVPRNKPHPPDWIKFVNKKLTYTAITRAKESIDIIDCNNEIQESISIIPPERKDQFYTYLIDPTF